MQITVVLPVYNAERTISTALDSVLEQSVQDLQVLVIDDASTDGTSRIVDGFAARDPRIRVVRHSANLGDGPSRSDGLARATGDWLLFLDADDQFEDGAFEVMLPRLQQTSCDVLVFRFSMFDEASGTSWDCDEAFPLGRYPREGFDPGQHADDLFLDFRSSVWNKCFRVSFLRDAEIDFQRIPRVGDVSFALTSLALASSIELLDRTVYRYNIHNDTGLTSSGDSYPLSFFDASLETLAQLQGRGVWDVYRVGLLNWITENLPYNLQTMKTLDGYTALLDAFQSEGFVALGFTSLDRNEARNPWAFDCCSYMIDHDVQSCLSDIVDRERSALKLELDRQHLLRSDYDAFLNSVSNRIGRIASRIIRTDT